MAQTICSQARAPSSLVFKVHRREPELITPEKPTPHEFKYLSDIDDQEGLRFHIPLILIYPNKPSMRGKDPVKTIRDAIARALVFYYPFAGRLKEGTNRKLMVECTGEGILFIEADAQVTLQQFGDALHPPFPCFEELLFDVPGSTGVLNTPLLLLQVTRLECGGFILALRLNHTMSDAPGLAQFLSAIGEIARGSPFPSLLPVWARHFLNASDPPQVTHQHPEYEPDDPTINISISTTTSDDDDISTAPLKEEEVVHRSIFFGPKEISTLRGLVPHRHHTTLEIIIACLWKCRTIALRLNPREDVRVMIVVNGRNRFNPPLPIGYYGNAFTFPAAVTTAGNLSRNPLGYALDFVQEAKAQFTEAYIRSVAALMVIKSRPPFTATRSWIVSDNTRAGFQDVDVGWGKPIYAGVAMPGAGNFPGVSYLGSFTNEKGEKGIVAPICLPALAMQRFENELRIMLKAPLSGHHTIDSKFIKSSL